MVTLVWQFTGGIDFDLFHNIPVLTSNFKISLSASDTLCLEICLSFIKIALIAVMEESV